MTGAKAWNRARRSGRRSGRSAGAARLQDFPAAVESSRDFARASATRPRLARVPRRQRRKPATRARDLPRPASAREPRQCGNRTSSDSPAAAPASRQRPRAGRESGAQPRAHEADLGPWKASKSQGEHRVIRSYQAKWANALLASAMRCTFSRRVIAAPSRLNAAINSSASLTAMGRPFFSRAAISSQRIERVC